MDFSLLLLAALIGAGVSEAVIVLLSLPDPPPPAMKALGVLVAGALVGIAGGWLGYAVAGSNPMPALWGSGAGGLLASGLGAVFGASGKVAR